MELPPDAPTVRLCHITKWPSFSGYGFNLHTDKSKNIQSLGEIDKGSPAEAAGLMKGDRIVEVNGQNVFNENHRQVVERIKAVPNETRLLVVDPISDQWYRDRNIVINGSLPSVKMLTSSKEQQPVNNNNTITTAPSPVSQVTNGSAAVVSSSARLCHLRKWPDFDGYGFNLHADKTKGNQFIGDIDPNSPAETAGLMKNDKIIEVNGENIEELSHREIVERIKRYPNETTLLVVDEPTLAFYRQKGIKIKSTMENIKRLETPSTSPRNNNVVVVMPPQVPTKAQPVEEPKRDMSHLVPRKCYLKKWADYDGYGFNLHADKKNNLHYIGDVDEGSPAKLGGLRTGDRLVEVNGVSIENIAHREIIEKIKSNPDETTLLVVCKETDEEYRRRGIALNGNLEEVKFISTPAREVDNTDNESKTSTPKMLPSTPSSNRSEELPPATPSTTLDEYDMNGVNSPSPAMNVEPPAYNEARNGRSSVESPTMDELSSAVSTVNMTDGPPVSNGSREDNDGQASPIFSMKASDVREMLRQRKKKDPRVQNMDLMQKFKIMEQL